MAWSFDGTGDYISAATPTSWTNFSISFWFKTTYTTDYRNIMGWGEAGFDNLQILINYDSGYLEGSTAYSFCFFAGKAAGNRSIRSFSDSSLWDGEWHHALCVRSTASSSLAVYIDGVSKTITGEQSLDSSAIVIDESNMPIGARYYKGSGIDLPFVGDIGEVGIYNAALTAADAVALSKFSPKCIRIADLQQYYPLVSDPHDIRAGVAGTANGDAAPSGDHPPIIYPSHQILQPPKKGRLWVNDSPSWDSGAVLQKHPGKKLVGYDTINIEGTVAETPVAANASTATYNLPTGVQAGELLVLHWVSHDEARPHSLADTPAGWTFGFSKYLSGGSGTFHGVFWKIADGTESGGTVEINYNGGTSQGVGMCYRVSGVDLKDPFHSNNYTGGVQGSAVSVWALAPGTLFGIKNVYSRIMLGIHSQGQRTISVGDGHLTLAESMDGTSPVSYALHLLHEDHPGDNDQILSNSTYSITMSSTYDYSHLIYELKAAPLYTGWTDTDIVVGQEVNLTKPIDNFVKSQTLLGAEISWTDTFTQSSSSGQALDIPSGSNRYLLFVCCDGYSGANAPASRTQTNAPSTITVGGQTLSRVVSNCNSDAASRNDTSVAVYAATESQIAAMTNGAWQVVWGYGTGGGVYLNFYALWYQNVNQAVGILDKAASTVSDDTPAITVTTQAKDIVVMLGTARANTDTFRFITSNDTHRHLHAAATGNALHPRVLASEKIATGISTTVEQTVFEGEGEQAANVAVVLRPVTQELSGQLYLGIENREGDFVWKPITVERLKITDVSVDDTVPSNEVPWVITGIGMGAR